MKGFVLRDGPLSTHRFDGMPDLYSYDRPLVSQTYTVFDINFWEKFYQVQSTRV